ncbi:hypothetical protein PV11_03790 [Exophiala sideris]|uniref:SWR1-complex protein 5 n=1 Tax=Exophiala sideris TaxID=1016849 RepID=A0A0D1YKQ9_9EURO|nr:hypothetical protein PV11_03790 [Exophiala sideris]
MVDFQDPDSVREEDYDEEADSDFQAEAGDEDLSSTSADEAQNEQDTDQRPRKRRKLDKAQEVETLELDSGDEATIREQRKSHKKQRKHGEDEPEQDGNQSDGWQARTRAMRTQEKEELKRSKLASVKGSTIDVDKLWEEMNRPRPLRATPIAGDDLGQADVSERSAIPTIVTSLEPDADKENLSASVPAEETITIKRTYKFAGEVHVEEKTVPKSSAEAQLWLAQQQSSKAPIPAADGRVIHRPLRRISRFDPNFSNLEAFKALWVDKNAHATALKGPKLNVVEKSKMDWAAHVDTEGLKEELDTHAKAKDGYLSRMDFLKGVEERTEAEARAARLKGH